MSWFGDKNQDRRSDKKCPMSRHPERDKNQDRRSDKKCPHFNKSLKISTKNTTCNVNPIHVGPDFCLVVIPTIDPSR